MGVKGGLQHQALDDQLQAAGLGFMDYIQIITVEVAVVHTIVGTFIPLFMCAMMTRFFGENKSWKEGLAIWPFALFGGLSFTIPYLLTGIFLGPEFPSLLGALIGLGIVITAARRGFLLPKDTWGFADQSSWPKSWMGSISMEESDLQVEKKIPLWKAWLPYLLVALLLVISRLEYLPVKSFLSGISLKCRVF